MHGSRHIRQSRVPLSRWPGRCRALRASAVLAALAFAGCATYEPVPLPSRPPPDPAPADLADAGSRLDRPWSAPIRIDLSQPLSPVQLGVIAVIANPDLRALRAQARVAEAQALAAGLLPDPQFSFSTDRPASDPGLVDALAAGLGMDTSTFYTRPVAQRVARATLQQVRLDLAWQEWQVAGQARVLAARVAGLNTVERLARSAARAVDDVLDRALRAVARGDLPAGDLEARRIAAADAEDRARTAERDLRAAQLELNGLLGLSPEAALMLSAAPRESRAAPEARTVVERAYDQRLDLAALRAAYEGQEASVKLAVLEQYPRLSLSLNAARDTGAVRTNGIAVGFDLPLWNRSRGAIAVQKATRSQLGAEYEARLFATRMDITALIEAYVIGVRQRDELDAQVAPLRVTVAGFERAEERGDIARAAAETARQALIDKEIALAILDQALAEQWVALEMASGALIGDSK